MAASPWASSSLTRSGLTEECHTLAPRATTPSHHSLISRAPALSPSPAPSPTPPLVLSALLEHVQQQRHLPLQCPQLLHTRVWSRRARPLPRRPRARHQSDGRRGRQLGELKWGASSPSSMATVASWLPPLLLTALTPESVQACTKWDVSFEQVVFRYQMRPLNQVALHDPGSCLCCCTSYAC